MYYYDLDKMNHIKLIIIFQNLTLNSKLPYRLEYTYFAV